MILTIPSFGFGKTGGDRMLTVIANNFIKRGHKVNLVNLGRRPLPFSLSPKVNIITVPFATSKRDRLNFILQGMKKLARSLPPSDIFLANYVFTVIPCLAHPGRGQTVFLAQANEVPSWRKKEYKILEGLAHATYKLNIPIVTPSAYLQKLIRERYGNRTVVIPPCLNLKFPAKAKRGKRLRLLFVGNMRAENKGFEFLYRAAEKLTGLDFELHVATQQEKNYRAKFPLYTHKPKNDRELARIYRDSDVFFHLSREEGFGLTLLEAMAAGLVCLVTDSGGVNEMIEPGKNCLRVERNARAIAAGLRRVGENLGYYRDRLTARAEKTARRYTEKKMVDAFEGLFKKLIK
jgi:glycosyltransferase involved in cell wall biosynthesis